MNTSILSESIPIIGEQIAVTLNDAHLALERYVEGGTNAKDLQLCGELLHSVRGALQIAEIYGAGLLAEEMEATCDFFVTSSSGDSGPLVDEGVEALSRAMVQLPTYVEKVIDGGRDVPLVLLPLLNDLRAVRSNPLLSESTLLLLKLKSPRGLGDQLAERSPSGEDLNEVISQYRPQFQLGLLGWIKNSASELDLQRMSSVAERLEAAASHAEVYQLWWVVGGIIEALLDNGLESSVALKRLVGQADREIKRLQEQGEAAYAQQPPTNLINNLLYYIARSNSSGQRVEAIRAAFNLTALVPGDEQVEHLRESLAAPSPKLMKSVADAIREDLGKTKDVLDIFVRTGMQDVSELEPHIDMLRKISDTLGVLGLGALRETVQKRSEDLQKILSDPSQINESTFIDLAAALLQVEDRLDSDLASLVTHESDTATETDVDPDFQQVTQAVMRECMVNLARTKEVISEVLAHPDDLAALDVLPGQFQGINAGLTMIGKTRAAAILDRLAVAIDTFIRPDAQFGSDVINRLADAIVSLEYYLETMAAGRKEPAYMLDNAERCLGAIETAQPIAPPVGALEDIVHTGTMRLSEADMDHLQALERPEPTQVLQAPALASDADRPDPEILELFIEEAGEEIVSIQRHYPVWAENISDDEALITLRRSFHTLKGSGRMVGAAIIGEFGWSIENLLNRLINQTLQPSAAVVAFVGDAVTALPGLLEQFEAGADAPENLAELMTDAEIFANGGIAERYAALNETDESASSESEPIAVDAAEPAAAEPAREKTSLDPVLLEILDKETAGHLQVLRKFVKQHIDATTLVNVSEALHRACHTLKGSLTMANAVEAVGIATPLYDLVDLHFRREIGLDSEALELCGKSARAIEQVMLYLAGTETDAPNFSELCAQLVDATNSIAIDDPTGDTDTAEQKILHVSVDDEFARSTTDVDFDLGLDSDEELLSPSELDVTDSELLEESELGDIGAADVHNDVDSDVESDDAADDTSVVDDSAGENQESIPSQSSAPPPEFDAEIAAIFAEEATEILSSADSAMEVLADERTNAAPLAELQRHLHTLKRRRAHGRRQSLRRF